MTDRLAASAAVASLVAAVEPVDDRVAAEAEAHHLQLTKPPGSLGEIERVGARLAAMAGVAVPPPAEPATAVVFAADHGVHAEGVSPWPQEVTAQMVASFLGGGAAITSIAASNGIDVLVVNVGVATPLTVPDGTAGRLRDTPVRRGTANLAAGPAMGLADAEAAILLGAEVAADLADRGAGCLLTGDMGIANTTPSAAVIAALTGADPIAITGRGTGIDDATLAAKQAIVAGAVERLLDGCGRPDRSRLDGCRVLAEVGGLEIGAIAGFVLAAAARRIPVIVDGVITLAGALVAAQLQPAVVGYLVAGHRSVEPAASVAIDHLGLDPLLELDLRLGEGTGAALAYPLVRAAARVMTEMTTFDEAGITGD